MTEKCYGLYYGDVVSIEDPKNLGRIRVRVHSVMGENTESDPFLPWARVCVGFGGFNDGGSYYPYPVGSKVVVAFEQGDPSSPIIIGGVQRKPPQGMEYKSEYGDFGGSSWTTMKQENTDIPAEVLNATDKNIYICFKTPKGATLIVYEGDEEESLKLIDRAGQSIEMKSPVKSAENIGNAAQRGSGSVDISKIDNTAEIVITDLKGQEIKMVSSASFGQTYISIKPQGNIYIEKPPSLAQFIHLGGSVSDPCDPATDKVIRFGDVSAGFVVGAGSPQVLAKGV